MSTIVRAAGLSKRYGKVRALDNVNLEIPPGRIVGLIGPNGAGKTTALNAILGLTSFNGTLEVLGRNPMQERHALMQNVCFIADVAILPRWIKVHQVLDFVEGVHPGFSRAKAESFLAKTKVRMDAKVKQLSKGMTAQLHLAVVMSIDARLLVLDEPTLGLDILFRKEFYTNLLNDYFDEQRTILVSTHQVEEIEHILTDLIFIQDGRIVLNATMEDVHERFCEVMVAPSEADAARQLNPMYERQVFGKHIFLFDRIDAEQAQALGEVHRPSVADLFIATIRNGEAA